MLKAGWSGFRLTEVSAATKHPIQIPRRPTRGSGSGFLQLVMARIGHDTISADGPHLILAEDRSPMPGSRTKAPFRAKPWHSTAEPGSSTLTACAASHAGCRTVMVGHFEWSNGDHFAILLRHMSEKGTQHAQEAVASVRRRGFVNFFCSFLARQLSKQYAPSRSPVVSGTCQHGCSRASTLSSTMLAAYQLKSRAATGDRSGHVLRVQQCPVAGLARCFSGGMISGVCFLLLYGWARTCRPQ
jgi:hypothetical protein